MAAEEEVEKDVEEDEEDEEEVTTYVHFRTRRTRSTSQRKQSLEGKQPVTIKKGFH